MQTFTICASKWIFSRKLNNYHMQQLLFSGPKITAWNNASCSFSIFEPHPPTFQNPFRCLKGSSFAINHCNCSDPDMLGREKHSRKRFPEISVGEKTVNKLSIPQDKFWNSTQNSFLIILGWSIGLKQYLVQFKNINQFINQMSL